MFYIFIIDTFLKTFIILFQAESVLKIPQFFPRALRARGPKAKISRWRSGRGGLKLKFPAGAVGAGAKNLNLQRVRRARGHFLKWIQVKSQLSKLMGDGRVRYQTDLVPPVKLKQSKKIQFFNVKRRGVWREALKMADFCRIWPVQRNNLRDLPPFFRSLRRFNFALALQIFIFKG